MGIEHVEAVRALARATSMLRAAGVIRSARVVGDLGEWYAEVLFGGRRAEGQTQKGWDVAVEATNERLQVKAQRYDKGNRWNYLDGDPALFTHLVVVVLTDDFRLRAVYKVPTASLQSLLRTESTTNRRSYHWDDLKTWRVDLRTHPQAAAIAELIDRETA
jgi:hypothetical protein